MNILSKMTRWRWRAFALFCFTLLCVNNSLQAHNLPRPTGEIVGRVTSQKHTPEAGVWVIAEAPKGLPTSYRKIVVTDDNGYFVIPELPYLDYPDHSDEDGTGHEGTHGGHGGIEGGMGHEKRYPYHVWVRGYDIEDSEHVTTQLTHNLQPGDFNEGALRLSVKRYDLTNREEAFANAQRYPANYWWSLYEPPVLPDPTPLHPYFPISRRVLESELHHECWYCHQIGDPRTRQVTTFERYKFVMSWGVHLQQVYPWDYFYPPEVGAKDLILNSYAEWASKITNDKMIPEDKAPDNRPNRPTGIERNVVITQWDWATKTPPDLDPNLPIGAQFIHDVVSTDKRNPSTALYRNGKVWGANSAGGTVEALDPNTHEIFTYKPDFPPPFLGGDLLLMSELPENGEPEQNKLYIQLTNGEIQYVALALDGTIIEESISNNDPDIGNFTIPNTLDLSDPVFKQGVLNITSNRGHTPFLSIPSWANFHNPMLDDKGKLWLTGKAMNTFSPEMWPDFCYSSGGNIHGDYLMTYPYIQIINNRQLVYFDPEQETFYPIPTCYDTHHLHFDPNGIIWTSGDWRVGGTFFDPSKYDPNDPSTISQAQGFTPKNNAYLTPLQPKPPAAPVFQSDFGYNYGMIPNPNDRADGGETILSIWTAQINETWSGVTTMTSGRIQRFVPYEVKRKGNGELILDKNGLPILTNPSSQPTGYGKFEFYFPFVTDNVGNPLPGSSFEGHNPRGIDVTSDGRIFTAYNNTGYLAEFDHNKPGVGINDGAAPGWRTWEIPGPRVRLYSGAEDLPAPTANSHYYLWVDQFNTLGVKDDAGDYLFNMVVVTGTNSDSFFLFDSTKGKEEFIAEIRIPYPMGFFSRGLDGRIDDPDAGWKGRGWWAGNNIRNSVMIEKTERPNINKIQLRDTPLDR